MIKFLNQEKSMRNKYLKAKDQKHKEMGWTHRVKGASREPYLKLQQMHTEKKKGQQGETFVDMDQKFRWYYDEDVVEL